MAEWPHPPTHPTHPYHPTPTTPITPPCSSGLLSNIPGSSIRSQLENPVDRQQLEGLASKFVEDIRAGTHRQEGWSNSMYGISKVSMYGISKVSSAARYGRSEISSLSNLTGNRHSRFLCAGLGVVGKALRAAGID